MIFAYLLRDIPISGKSWLLCKEAVLVGLTININKTKKIRLNFKVNQALEINGVEEEARSTLSSILGA